VVRQLFEQAGFPHVPAVFGKLTYESSDGTTFDTCVLQAFVNNRTDLWQLAMDEIALYLERASAATEASAEPASFMQGWMDLCVLLGRRTAEIHLALAGLDHPEFEAEVFDPFSLRGACHSMTSRASLVLQRLEVHESDTGELVSIVRERLQHVQSLFREMMRLSNPGRRIRVHGDLHLGQALHTGDDIVFIDFEGDSNRPLAERRMKTTPLVDAAGLLHSLRYAAASASSARVPGSFAWARRRHELDRATATWYEHSAAAFLNEYRRTLGSSPVVPSSESEFRSLLKICCVAKAAYQLGYELDHRPDWLPIAMRTFLDSTDAEGS
jgi:maltose alpha-D-glucosyltransferase/alpha-amylase